MDESNDDADSFCGGVVRGRAVLDVKNGSRFDAKMENWNRFTVGANAETLCGFAGLDDDACGRLHDLERLRWRLARGACDDLDATSEPGSVSIERDVPRPSPGASLNYGAAPSPTAPAPADALLHAPPARRGPPPAGVLKWRPPSGGVAAALARDVTAAWRAWGIGPGAVAEAAAADDACVV